MNEANSVPVVSTAGTDFDILKNDASVLQHEQDSFIYQGFQFERPIYLVIWEVLVIIAAIVNGIVIAVFSRKKMRSPTNIILTSIAVSDTLTGLVTLPTYIMVYLKYTSSESNQQPEYGLGKSDHSTEVEGIHMVHMRSTRLEYGIRNGYVLNKDLCRWFMLTKFFLSKSLHSMSIFLTLFLAFQRYVSYAFPFSSKQLLTKCKTLIVCVVIVTFSPMLHVYHLFKEKADDGMCMWSLDNCPGDCAFLWIIFIVRHFIPCSMLYVFSGLFVRELRRTGMSSAFGSKIQAESRRNQDRRVTVIVILIVLVFLIPEIPYSVFLLVSVINEHMHVRSDLGIYRALHASYELGLVVSFNANFFIYTCLNCRFRQCLCQTLRHFLRPSSQTTNGSRHSLNQNSKTDRHAVCSSRN